MRLPSPRAMPPTRWLADPALRPELDLDGPRLCGVGLGEPIAGLAGLGPPEAWSWWRAEVLRYPEHGLEVGTEAGRVAYLLLVWADPFRPGWRGFRGRIRFRGREVPLGRCTPEAAAVAYFGPPYWRYADDEGVRLFYEVGPVEWQLHFQPDGALGWLWIAPPLLADPRQRRLYGVDRPWPPR